MYNSLKTRQFQDPQFFVLEVDGSAVTTSASSTGLTVGKHRATILKGTAGDANLITIAFNTPFGFAPRVFVQERTLDCVARLEADPSKTGFQIRTFELDGVTAENDADLTILVLGAEYGLEY